MSITYVGKVPEVSVLTGSDENRSTVIPALLRLQYITLMEYLFGSLLHGGEEPWALRLENVIVREPLERF